MYALCGLLMAGLALCAATAPPIIERSPSVALLVWICAFHPCPCKCLQRSQPLVYYCKPSNRH